MKLAQQRQHEYKGVQQDMIASLVDRNDLFEESVMLGTTGVLENLRILLSGSD